MKVWVLTSDYNDYNQHGQYYEGVWCKKPSREQLINSGVDDCDVSHVLNGGGRVKNEYKWFYLTEEVI